jgi:hypothetical protein
MQTSFSTIEALNRTHLAEEYRRADIVDLEARKALANATDDNRAALEIAAYRAQKEADALIRILSGVRDLNALRNGCTGSHAERVH